MSRGRPPIEDPKPRTKYTQEFTDTDGSVVTWYYDVDKFANGPWKVDVVETVIQESFEEKTLDYLRHNVNTLTPKTRNGLGMVGLNN